MPEPQRKAAFVQPGHGAHLAWNGELVSYVAVGEQTGRHCAVALQTLAPGGGTVASIRHRDHAGFYVLSGEVTASAGNRTLTLAVGSFLNVPAGTAHRISNVGVEPASLLRIAAPAGFDEFQFRSGLPLTKLDERPAPLSPDEQEAVAFLGAGYGVELHPTATAFQIEPKLRLTLPGEGKTLALVGDLYRFLAGSDDTGGRYSLLQTTIGPGSGPSLHRHSREDEFVYVLKGTVSFEADGATAQCGPGVFVHLPSGTKHRFTNETAEPAEMLILTAPAGFESFVEAVGRPWHDQGPLPGPPTQDEIERLVSRAPDYGIELFP